MSFKQKIDYNAIQRYKLIREGRELNEGAKLNPPKQFNLKAGQRRKSLQAQRKEDPDWLVKAESAIQRGDLGYHMVRKDIEGKTSFVLWDNPLVVKYHKYLLRSWLNVNETEYETKAGSQAPKWVDAYRYKALNEKGNSVKQGKFGDMAIKMADAVQKESETQAIRRKFVDEADASVGSLVMSAEDIKAEQSKEAKDGYTPSNFTTCIKYYGDMNSKLTSLSGLKSPILSGVNAYKEIDPQRKKTLPKGAWVKCSPEKRPKPGDWIIYAFNEPIYDNEGKFKYGEDWFSHVSILRSIMKKQDTTSTKEGSFGKEDWRVIDGGGTNAKEGILQYDPDICKIKGPGEQIRKIKGWIDIEKMAAIKLQKQKEHERKYGGGK